MAINKSVLGRFLELELGELNVPREDIPALYEDLRRYLNRVLSDPNEPIPSASYGQVGEDKGSEHFNIRIRDRIGSTREAHWAYANNPQPLGDL
jgi:hypothetical protein